MTCIRMKKQVSPALSVLLLLAVSASLFAQAGLCARADAHSGGRVYPVAELTDEMLEQIQLHDGRIDEWIELIGEPAMTLLDFQTHSNYLPPDPSDLDFRIWLAWHDDPDRFYVAFVASDDVYRNDHDHDGYGIRTNIPNYDSITLTIDGDHGGGAGTTSTSTEEELMEASGQAQLYDAIARTASGPTMDNYVGRRTGAFSWKLFPPYGDAGGGVFGEAPVISVIELYVTPYDRWGTFDGIEETEFTDLDPAGQVIGFAIDMVEDWDLLPAGAGGRLRSRGSSSMVTCEQGIGWSWTPEAMQPSDPRFGTEVDIRNVRADFFLDGILLPAGAGPEDTAAESVSWGRIKASLME